MFSDICELHGGFEDHDEIREHVVCGAFDVPWMHDSILSALIENSMTDENGKPNFGRVDYVLDQLRQPYSTEEKIKALEYAGSCCILVGSFKAGIEYWKLSRELRPEPKQCTSDQPPPTCTDVKSAWADYFDLLDMHLEVDAPGGKLHLFYQAMFVRIGMRKTNVSEDVCSLVQCIKNYLIFLEVVHGDDCRENQIHLIMAMILLHEWDEHYNSTEANHAKLKPPSAHSCGLLNDLIEMLLCALAKASLVPTEEASQFLRFDNCMAILNWIISALGKLNARGTLSESEEHTVNSMLRNVSHVLMLVCELSLDESETWELECCVQKLVDADFRDSSGMNVLLITCFELNQSLKRGFCLLWEDVSLKQIWRRYTSLAGKVVRQLVEAGVDVKSVDKTGNSSLNFMLRDSTCDKKEDNDSIVRGPFVDDAIFQYLFANGAQLVSLNKEN